MACVFVSACIPPYVAMFTPVQLLWINLIMDTFAALALATESPNDILLQREPQNRSESIINAQMWRNIFCWGFTQMLVILVGIINFAPMLMPKCDYPSGANLYWEKDDLAKFANDPVWGDGGSRQAEIIYNTETGGTATGVLALYTLAFQTFVFMSLFNMINSRKLGTPSNPKLNQEAKEELNVFKGMCNNKMFLIILVVCFGVQVFMVQFVPLNKMLRL